MPQQSYVAPFLSLVEGSDDPHDCWQEDGFWPNRVAASLDDVLVWGTLIGLSYLQNGGMIHYLQFISGRTLPEMELGFEVLGCSESQRVCGEARQRFGNEFPRNDDIRERFVASDEPFFEACEGRLLDAMESDRYEELVEKYAKKLCVAHSVPPWIYPNLP